MLSLAFLAIQSCDNKKEKIDKYSEIMMIHDDAMPRMAEVQNLKQDLKKIAVNVIDSIQLASFNYSIGELEEADEMMMTWMNQWGKKTKEIDKNSNEYKIFLKAQKEEIINVSDRIFHAMEHAKETLHGFKQK